MRFINLIFYSYLIFSLYLTFKNKRNLLYAYIFALPFFGLMMDIGLQIDISKFLSFFMLLVIIPEFKKIPRSLSPIIIFLLYLTTITIILSISLPESVSKFPPLRGRYRWIFQIVMWFLMFIPFFYSQYFNKETKEIEKIYKIFLISLTLCVFLGFIQVICFNFTGEDIFPISILQGEDNYRMGMFNIANNIIFRMSSLGGEPKHLAYSIVIGLIILFSYFFNSKFIFSKKWDISLMSIMFVGLLLTFSTQGYFLFVIDLLFLLIINKKFNKIFYLLCSFILVMFFINSLINISLEDLFYYRVIREANSFSILNYIEDYNEAVLGFLIDYPKYLLTGVGVGNIHLWAQNYIPSYAEHYMIGNVFVAKSGLLRLLSEVGIIGTALFFYAFLKPFTLYKKGFKIHYVISLLIIINFLVSQDGPLYFPVAFIIIYNLYNNCKARSI